MKKYKSTRELYKTVKKYDHQQFDTFCTKLYENGYLDGKDSVVGLDIKMVIDVISSVKGVGPALKERIENALYSEFAKYMEEGENNESAD